MKPSDFTVVFDAMGVLYAVGDDESDLLIPYLRELGCSLDENQIKQAYREASLGQMTSSQFWRACAVAGDDLAYCSRHTLTPGIAEILAELADHGVRLACLSNDLSQWSRLLRQRFELERWIDTWVISADFGVRKPSPAAFTALIEQTGRAPERTVFFDDRPANVEAARTLGLDAVLFTDSPACRDALRQRGLL